MKKQSAVQIKEMKNAELLDEYLDSMSYAVLGLYTKKLREEILRRMACYSYALKPLNKKLYGKLRINI